MKFGQLRSFWMPFLLEKFSESYSLAKPKVVKDQTPLLFYYSGSAKWCSLTERSHTFKVGGEGGI